MLLVNNPNKTVTLDQLAKIDCALFAISVMDESSSEELKMMARYGHEWLRHIVCDILDDDERFETTLALVKRLDENSKNL